MSGYKRPARILMFTLIFAFWVWAIGRAADAEAHYRPGVHNTRHAINLAFCGKSNSYCGASSEAWSVARCETGGTFSVWANNGQYLGLFQVSENWRRTIPGFRFNPWAQARHAHTIYVRTGGWSHWECRP
jgi:hypothetical protein